MNRRDFHIGLEFQTDGGTWRCKDVGTRTICAIKIDSLDRGNQVVLTREQAEADGWFNGPPFHIVEYVFDEYSQEGCWVPGDPDRDWVGTPIAAEDMSPEMAALFPQMRKPGGS